MVCVSGGVGAKAHAQLVGARNALVAIGIRFHDEYPEELSQCESRMRVFLRDRKRTGCAKFSVTAISQLSTEL